MQSGVEVEVEGKVEAHKFKAQVGGVSAKKGLGESAKNMKPSVASLHSASPCTLQTFYALMLYAFMLMLYASLHHSSSYITCIHIYSHSHSPMKLMTAQHHRHELSHLQ